VRTSVPDPGSRTRLSSGIDSLLGRHIRASRIRCGLSQTELGQKIGVSFQQVQKYERGANRISASTLVLIAGALGVSAAELLQLADAAIHVGAHQDLAADPVERQLLRTFRDVSSPAQRQAIVDLVTEMAKI
jgi:transcriptional regulator with XRE-family HTH domain